MQCDVLVCIRPLMWSHGRRLHSPPTDLRCDLRGPRFRRQVWLVVGVLWLALPVHDYVTILWIFLMKLCIAHPEGRCAEDAEQRAFALVPIYPDVPASVPRTVRVLIIP